MELVIQFWFEELNAKQWFVHDPQVDQKIRDRFLDTHTEACRCELSSWRKDALGRLAEIIVLDQFSRNLYRDDPRAFAQDPLALALAQEAVRSGADQSFTPPQKAFLYMPYMHSESLKIHDEALRLFAQSGLEFNLDFERKHKAILDRFGRYPHRNAVLGRASTPEEVEFLKSPESSF